MTEHTAPAPLPELDEEDLATVTGLMRGTQRRAEDTNELRARIIGGMLAQFVRDPSPRSGRDVHLSTCALHGLAPNEDWYAIPLAMTFLVRGGLLTCNTFDPATGNVIHNDDTVIAGSPALGVYRISAASHSTVQ